MEIVRKSISFPKELADRILERAKEYNRSFSAQVVYDMNAIIHMDILMKECKPDVYLEIGGSTKELEEQEIEDKE